MEEDEDIEIVCIKEERRRRKHKKKRSRSKYEDEDRDRRKRRKEEKAKEDNSSDIIELFSDVKRKRKRKKKKTRRRSTSYSSDDRHRNIKQENKNYRIKEEIVVDDSDVEVTSNNYSKSKYKKRESDLEIKNSSRYTQFETERKVYSPISREYSCSSQRKMHHDKDKDKTVNKGEYEDRLKKWTNFDLMDNERERLRNNENERERYERTKYGKTNINDDKLQRYPSDKISNQGKNTSSGNHCEVDILKKALKRIGNNDNDREGNSSKSFQKISALNEIEMEEILQLNEPKGSSLYKNTEEIMRWITHTEEVTAASNISSEKQTSLVSNEIRNETEINIITDIRTPHIPQPPTSFTDRRLDLSFSRIVTNKANIIEEQPQKNHLNNLPISSTKNTSKHLSRMTKGYKGHEPCTSRISKLNQENQGQTLRHPVILSNHKRHNSTHLNNLEKSYEEKMKSGLRKEKPLPIKTNTDVISILNKFPNIQKQMELANNCIIANPSTNAVVSSGSKTVTDNSVVNENIVNNNSTRKCSKQLPIKNLVITSQEEIILSDTENSPSEMFHDVPNTTSGIANHGNKNNLVHSTENTRLQIKSIKALKQDNDEPFDNETNTNKNNNKKEKIIENTRIIGDNESKSHVLLNPTDQYKRRVAAAKEKYKNQPSLLNEHYHLTSSEIQNTLAQMNNKTKVNENDSYLHPACQKEHTDVPPSINKTSHGKESKSNKHQNVVSYNMNFENVSYQVPSDENLEQNNSLNESPASDTCENLFTIENVQGNVNVEKASHHDLHAVDMQKSDVHVRHETEINTMNANLHSEKKENQKNSDVHIRHEKESNIMNSTLHSVKEEKHNSRDSCIKEEIVTQTEIHSEVYDQVDSKAFVRSILNENLDNFDDTESKVRLHKNLNLAEKLTSDHLHNDNLCNNDTQKNCVQCQSNESMGAQANEFIHNIDSNIIINQNTNDRQTVLGNNENHEYANDMSFNNDDSFGQDEVENHEYTNNVMNFESDYRCDQNTDEMQEEFENSSLENNRNHDLTNDMNFDNTNNANTTENSGDPNQPSSSHNISVNEKHKNITAISSLDSLQDLPPESNNMDKEVQSSESTIFQIADVWSTAITSQDNDKHYPIPEDLAEVVEIGRVQVTKTSACSFSIKKENQDERNFYVAHKEIEACPMCQRKLNNDQFKFNPSTMILTMVCFCNLTIYQLLNPEKHKEMRVR
ncbi:unnamed protein product [Meganyctiphanes norvegica]|uniref:Uncharacterized protein n=1 Tax=Meganyctiphanes norvegica TaxID=48144 RepID=A0AAV2RMP9_MEGNR